MSRHLSAVVALAACLQSCATTWPEWEDEPHHVSVLLAGTAEEQESAPSIGLDYEYRASDVLGIGLVAEYAFEDIDATTLLAVADIHFTKELAIQTGPGVEFIESDEVFVYRIGVLYEMELRGGYTVSPQLHYDMTSGENALVFGLAFGVGF